MGIGLAQWKTALHWVMTQPGLLEGLPGGHRPLLATDDPRLAHLMAETDSDPSRLNALLSAPRAHKVGIAFEALMQWGLECGFGYRVIGRDVQVHAEGRTVGALDALLESPGGEVEHWEFAYKLFLQSDGGVDWSSWLGPGGRDRLDTKVGRMLDHQLPLSVRPEAQSVLQRLGVGEIARHRAVLQGVLFTPWEGPECRATQAHRPAAGRWVRRSDVAKLMGEWPASQWVRRRKPMWFGPWEGPPSQRQPAAEVSAEMEAFDGERAQLWSVWPTADSADERLCFVVSDQWGHTGE